MTTFFAFCPLRAQNPGGDTPFKVSERRGTVTFTARDVRFSFDRNTGRVSSYKVRGVEYISGGDGFQPVFWCEDPAVEKLLPANSEIWKKNTRHPKVTAVEPGTPGPESVSLAVRYGFGEYEAKAYDGPQTLDAGALNVEYLLFADGRLQVRMQTEAAKLPLELIPEILDGPSMMYNPNQPEEERRAEIEQFNAWVKSVQDMAHAEWLKSLPALPRFGMRLQLPAAFRPAGAGRETGVNGVSLTDARGRGLDILSETAFGYEAAGNAFCIDRLRLSSDVEVADGPLPAEFIDPLSEGIVFTFTLQPK